MVKKVNIALVLLMALFSVNFAFAQIDYENDARYMKFGATAEERKTNHTNYVFFGEEMKMKSYDSAEKRLEELLINAPAGTENLYINGRRLYIQKLREAKTQEDKMAYVDKLVRLQEIRNEHFAHVASRGTKEIYKTRLLDFMQYNPDAIDRIIKYADDAMAAAGNNVDPDMVTMYFNILTNAYMSDLVMPDVYLNNYELIASALSGSSKPDAADRLKDCESIFIQSGAADCTNLEKIYKPKYDEDPNNADLMKKVMGYLIIGNCDSPFRIELSEKLFELKPEANVAFMLAQTFDKAGDSAKAKLYIEKAIELETDPVEKAKYLVRVAATSLADNDPSSAVKYSKQAIANDSQNGLAYLILSQAYGSLSTKTGCKDLKQKAIYWIIVDNLLKAKSLLADDAEQVKRINELVGSYSQHYPTVEQLFFDPEMKEGQRYTVNCGVISGVTTVRASK